MIAIIDYGLGNIKAFGNIYNRLNIPYKYVSKPDDLEAATGIILPGVGSFDYAMEKLHDSELRNSLDHLVLNKKIPILGICVGMQIMAKTSTEGTKHGLGWIDSDVIKFDTNTDFPLPHMGWNNIITDNNKIFKDLDSNPEFYFLHSYYFEANNQYVIAKADYINEIGCIINFDNIYGIQCHPEKSHKAGIIFLKNFAEIANA